MAYTKEAPRRSGRASKKPELFSTSTHTTTRRPRAGGVTKKTTTTQKPTVAATHHKRKPTVKDKVVGAAKKVEGSLTNRPGKKAAGTKQMHGTDGKKKKKVAVVKK